MGLRWAFWQAAAEQRAAVLLWHPTGSAAEEDVQALVNKHKITPQGQAVFLCQPAKLFWEDFVLF